MFIVLALFNLHIKLSAILCSTCHLSTCQHLKGVQKFRSDFNFLKFKLSLTVLANILNEEECGQWGISESVGQLRYDVMENLCKTTTTFLLFSYSLALRDNIEYSCNRLSQ
jgi:hypothetical protein